MTTELTALSVLLAIGCTEQPQPEVETTPETTPADTAQPPAQTDVCTTPTADDHLYPPYPPVPDDCLEDYWDCPLEPGYASMDPSTVCNITDGYDSDGRMQEAFWEAYRFSRDYFGAYGPVYVYFMGPTSEESNRDIWQLRAERRAVTAACVPVEDQVEGFFSNPQGQAELDAAITGEGGYFSISGNSSCNPIMDLMMINPDLESIQTITMHEYNHIFQIAHSLTWDRSSDNGLNSWIMEGQATYSSALFGELTGWGPSFQEVMMSMKTTGNPVSPVSIDAFLAEGNTFELDNEDYWSRDDMSAAVVYYQLGAWAWALLVHDLGGDYDVALKDYIQDVPLIGKTAAFEKHFGRTIASFFDDFDEFVRSDDDAWVKILQ